MGKKKNLDDYDVLYNAVLKTVKKHGAGMTIRRVRSVLSYLTSNISEAADPGPNNFSTVSKKLKKRKPRE